jgi:hypothetical protein
MDADCAILRDAFYPAALSNRFQPKRNRFVETFSGNFSGVLDSFRVSDGDAAGLSGHGTARLTYSLYIRHLVKTVSIDIVTAVPNFCAHHQT